MADPLATALELEAYLGREVGPAADLLLAGASDAVRAYCGWHVAPSVTEELTLDGSGERVQPLPSLHVTELASVEECGELVEVSEYEWSVAGRLRRGWAWTSELQGLLVTLTHGFDPVPAALKVLVLGLSARQLTNPSGVRSEAVGAVSVTYGEAGGSSGSGSVGSTLREVERAVLDRYRLEPEP